MLVCCIDFDVSIEDSKIQSDCMKTSGKTIVLVVFDSLFQKVLASSKCIAKIIEIQKCVHLCLREMYKNVFTRPYTCWFHVCLTRPHVRTGETTKIGMLQFAQLRPHPPYPPHQGGSLIFNFQKRQENMTESDDISCFVALVQNCKNKCCEILRRFGIFESVHDRGK